MRARTMLLALIAVVLLSAPAAQAVPVVFTATLTGAN